MATIPATLPAKAHSAFDMNAGAHMINCTHLVAAEGEGSEKGKRKLQAKMGWHLCTFQRPFVALRKYLTCISSTFKRRQRGREREREIEVGEKSQKSTAGITLRPFKYEYMPRICE